MEYQREGYDMFNTMMDGIKEESVTSLFNLQVQVQQDPVMAEDSDDPAGGVSFAPPAGSQVQPGQAQPAQVEQGRPAQQGRSRRGRGAADEAADGQVPAGLAAAPGLARPQRPGQLNYTAPSTDGTGAAEQRTTAAGGPDYTKVGRNAPCPCGSGKKFKVCHGDPRNR